MESIKLEQKELEKLLDSGNDSLLLERLSREDPADVADLLEELDPGIQERVFAMLDAGVASEVLVEMEPEDADDVLDSMSPQKLAKLLIKMAPDDAADIVGGLSELEREELFHHLPEEEKGELRELLGYGEETAGGLMTLEICSVSAESTVQEALNSITDMDFSDPISMIFAVDRDNRLVGAINISKLLSKQKNALLKDIVDLDTPYTRPADDQETVANMFRKYDLFVMPVVDSENRLIGRITADDVMDVLHEEAYEDMAHMAGAPDIEFKTGEPVRIVRLRLPWLMITLFTGMVISVIIQSITGMTEAVLAAFVPVIMAMGGNTGMQASAVTIRGIALGEIEFNQLIKISMREFSVGLMMGLICGLITGIIVWANMNYLHFAEIENNPVQLAVVVAVSMTCAMTFAAICGTFIPIILHRMRVDPALASGPFVTTGNDLSASLIYFLMCMLLLKL